MEKIQGSYAVETKAPDGYNLDEEPKPITLTVTGAVINDSSLGEADDVKLLDNYESTYSGSETGVTNASNANGTAASNNKVTWSSNSSSPTTITNKSGTTLPGTGGIGTTIFTFGGLALVILAAIMFIVYTKKQRRQA